MKFSIISPVYNAEPYLEKTINSVLKQTYADWEYILVNDGSTDNSLRILKTYADENPRIRYFNQQNQGPGIARNVALDHADGDYVVFLDADDYIDPMYLCELAECCQTNAADVVFVDVVQEDADGKVIKHELMSDFQHLSKERLIRWQMTGKVPWGGCRKAVSRILLNDNRIRYSADIVGEEAVYSFRVLRAAVNVCFLPKMYYHYVNYPNSQSKKGDEDPWGPIADSLKQYLILQGLYEQYKDTVNTFALTALLICMDRIAGNCGLFESVRRMRIQLPRCRQIRSENLDYDSMDFKVSVLKPFILHELFLIVTIVSKMRRLYARCLRKTG